MRPVRGAMTNLRLNRFWLSIRPNTVSRGIPALPVANLATARAKNICMETLIKRGARRLMFCSEAKEEHPVHTHRAMRRYKMKLASPVTTGIRIVPAGRAAPTRLATWPVLHATKSIQRMTRFATRRLKPKSASLATRNSALTATRYQPTRSMWARSYVLIATIHTVRPAQNCSRRIRSPKPVSCAMQRNAALSSGSISP